MKTSNEKFSKFDESCVHPFVMDGVLAPTCSLFAFETQKSEKQEMNNVIQLLLTFQACS